jgi:ABC-type antimicrobial peptide transport system permease subunit
LQSYGELTAQDAIRSEAATLLFGVLAALALILSLAGIYAVTAYSVEQRTREFGIRQAVGARTQDVMNDVFRGALLQTGIGIAAGLVLAAIFTRLLSGLLFEISPLDPLTYAGVIVLMLLAVIAAAVIPALRAAQIQPALAIRYE